MYDPLNATKTQDEDRDPFGRIPGPDLPDPEIEDLDEPASLSATVGETGKNHRRDVAKAETMLGRAGALDLNKTDGPTGYWGMRTAEATRNFQKKHGLKVDGVMKPGGETIRTLADVAGKADARRLELAQVPVPVPGVVPPLPAGLPPASPKDIDKALGRAERDIRAWWEDLTDAEQRTDQAPKLPNKEEFPADTGFEGDGVLPGRPAVPARVIGPLPHVPPTVGDDATPPFLDQSGDPDWAGPDVYEYTKFEKPIAFAKGGAVPPKTQDALDGLDPATAQLVKEAGLSDGTAISGSKRGIHIETGKTISQLNEDFRAMVRKFGDDPDGPLVTTDAQGITTYAPTNGINVVQRPDKQGGMTIEIQVPSPVGKGKLHSIKRRYH